MNRQDIEDLLHPRSIAVVGTSSRLGEPGAVIYLDVLTEMGYEGKIYPINPKASTALGLKTYPSLLDVPEEVDHVIVCVSARLVPTIVKDAVRKKVKSIHVFSSGFAESHTEEGLSLQNEIIEIAKGKAKIIGPNCLGFYYPKNKIGFIPDQTTTHGDAGFISQSGGLSQTFIDTATQERNYCSKVFSVGNSSDLKLTDFLEYLSEDPETKSISMYIEGLSGGEGQKFLTLLKDTTPKKPVLIMKGGQTDTGAKTATSHTGSLASASAYKIWESIARQYGATMVDGIHEMHDFLKLHRLSPLPKSKKTCLITVFGGNCVVYSDVSTKNRIEIPELTAETQGELLKFIPGVGTIRSNPIDLSDSAFIPNVLENVLITVGKDPNIDSIIFSFEFKFMSKRVREKMGLDFLRLYRGWVSAIAKAKSKIDVPILCINPMLVDSLEAEEDRLYIKNQLEEKQIPSFLTIERGAKALNRYCVYHFYLNKISRE